MLATPLDKQKLKNGTDRLKIEKVEAREIQFLERQNRSYGQGLDPMTHFIFPEGILLCHSVI